MVRPRYFLVSLCWFCTGLLPISFVSAEKPSDMWVVSASSLRLRGTPSSQGEIIATLPRGTIVTEPRKTGVATQVNGISGEWLKVQLGAPADFDGFLFSGYLRRLDTPITVVTCEGNASVVPADGGSVICGTRKWKASPDMIAVLYDMTCHGLGLHFQTSPSPLFKARLGFRTEVFIETESNRVVQIIDSGLPADFMGCHP